MKMHGKMLHLVLFEAHAQVWQGFIDSALLDCQSYITSFLFVVCVGTMVFFIVIVPLPSTTQTEPAEQRWY